MKEREREREKKTSIADERECERERESEGKGKKEREREKYIFITEARLFQSDRRKMWLILDRNESAFVGFFIIDGCARERRKRAMEPPMPLDEAQKRIEKCI